MAGSQSYPRINSVSDLWKIADLDVAFDVMTDHNIDSSDVCNMSDALAKIRQSFSKVNAKQIYHQQDRALKEAISADVSKRKTLRALFENARDYLNNLPPHFRKDLNWMFPNMASTMDSTLQQLGKQEECIILVAGEQGSGKSSLVNLVAGCQILPTGHLHGTKTICELRHSETRRFVLRRWDMMQPPPVKECPPDSDTGPFLQELLQHVSLVEEDTNKSPYEKIEIYWPLPILGEGLVIVDSPGIGANHEVSQQVEVYMAQASGFIYVLNTTNAGGLHKDKLGHLLRRATELNEIVDLSTVLFVCNWWDQVSLCEHDRVLEKTISLLSMVWPGVRRQQVFPLSCTDALRAVEREDILDEHRDLVQAIRRVLPQTFNAKLSVYYRWLSAVLKRSLYSLKIKVNTGRRLIADNEELFLNIRSQIEALETEACNQIFVMKDRFLNETNNITRQVIGFMKSEKCRKAVEQCPPPKCESKKFAEEAAAKFCEHLTSILNAFETQNGLVSTVKASILRTFRRNLELFEDQMKKIEGVMFEETDSIITDLHNSLRAQMSVKSVWKKSKGKQTEHGCFSLGHAVMDSRRVDVKSNAVKNALKASGSPAGAMAAVSVLFLKQFKDEDIPLAVKKFFDRIAKRFDAACRLLPEFLKADRRLLHILHEEVEDEQEMQANLYPDLMCSCSTLQGTLDMFYIQRLMFFEFDMNELKYDCRQRIGNGSFGDVYLSSVSNEETTQQVAVKVQRDNLSVRNVTELLLEDRILREVRHENIITYYGAATEKQGSDLRWVMVLGYCGRTIKQRFLSEDTNVPGRQKIVSLQKDAMRDMATFARQICSGLCYMHSKGFVHRDLKSDNIMLDENDVVKLVDMGVSKLARDIAWTHIGSPVYMAPEVLLEIGNYDMKADIYSLAIILWELWYGEDAADHISFCLSGSLAVAVERGLRPSITKSIRPPEDWLRIIQTAWVFEPSKRPTSQKIEEFFQNFLKITEG